MNSLVKKNLKNQKGFTLIELLIVIGILTVLLALVLVALNPARQFAIANNTKRSSDVNTILNAIHQYAADNKGVMPAGITTTVKNVSKGGADLCTLLVPVYIAQLPADPSLNGGAPIDASCPAGYDTGYQVIKSATNDRITVSASSVQAPGTSISVTR